MELIERRRAMMSAPHIKKDEGEILTFDTNFAKPLKMCQVGIEPVQDLHGYDSPWPAGGGKNKAGPMEVGTIQESKGAGTDYPGLKSSNTTRIRTIDLIPIGNNGRAVISFNASTYRMAVAGFDSEGLYLGRSEGWRGFQTTSPQTLNWANARYIIIILAKLDNSTITDSDRITAELQVETNTLVATAYEPYSNICPITGWDSMKVSKTGKNLFDATKLVGLGFSKGSGSLVAGNYSVFYCECYPGYTYTLSRKNGSATGRFSMAFTKELPKSGVKIYSTKPATYNNTQTVSTIVAPEGSKYVCVYLSNSGRTIPDDAEVQLELGSTATDYEPYQGDIYDIAFPTEAGTVYGGTLNMLTGELIVDSEMIEITSVTTTGTGYGVKKAGGQGSTTRKTEVLCNCLAVYTGKLANMPDNSICLYESNARHYDAFGIKINGAPAGNTTAQRIASVNAELDKLNQAGTPLTVVFYLTEPIRYQLTPQQLTALKGINNIWADTGKTRVAYYGH